MKNKLFLVLIIAALLLSARQSVQAVDPGDWFTCKMGELDQKMAKNQEQKKFSADQAGCGTGAKKHSDSIRRLKKYFRNQSRKSR